MSGHSAMSDIPFINLGAGRVDKANLIRPRFLFIYIYFIYSTTKNVARPVIIFGFSIYPTLNTLSAKNRELTQIKYKPSKK